MGKTIETIISWADEVIPNKLSSTSKIAFLSDLLGDGNFRKYNDEELQYDFYVSTHTAEYDMPRGIKIADLTYVGVSATTYNTTNQIRSTTPFTEYRYLGIDDSGIGYTAYTSKLAFVPKPSGKYHATLKYRPYYGPYTASSDTTTIIVANNNLINYLQYKLSAMICQAMAFPRIDLANNFELSAEYELMKARTQYYKYKRITGKKHLSYKRWWD